MTLMKLRENIQGLSLDIRNLSYLIRTKNFETAFEKANLDEQSKLLTLVKGCVNEDFKLRNDSFEVLRNILRKYKDDDNIQRLKDRACQLGIRNYSRMSKAELLSSLLKRKENESIQY